MIGELLPEAVVAVEAYGDDAAVDAPLYPEERAVVARAVDKRRREFASVRRCARHAMEKLGLEPRPVLPGERGAPRWPEGILGSMTHCTGYCAAALVRAGELASLGIDAEPHEALPEGVLGAVAASAERERVSALSAAHPSVHWDRLLFSAKEAVYKAWFPLTGRWLDFLEADLEIRPPAAGGTTGGFRATLLVEGPRVGDRLVRAFDGRWAAREGLLATAVAVPHGNAPEGTA
ncbi:4'-phosphopantetheinyl transferase superfamily protein [Streptomyces sp. ME02-6978a]|uniref:4'-phosphopantetheinyl transferase family protein n=1 Tax=unclassified Streptomyces TaxID=2593676 RepID=UPI0029B133CF|nr:MULTISPECIES: 4'-phosphopantetheinyl transferase superfamily protein [unclassified Streptomyces]MDX3087045.1 4'-phosphopantetheinyl transferase superfamily protein [Streptomyces sp. ME12-02E]MDX3330558.1 4'-phosphopantetheinyl transferase superfamily protein [Streptomyces sp. ME02-6978a]